MLRDRSLAELTLSGEAEINRLEVEIEGRCVELIARHQPEARDLRFVLMMFKVVNDLERVGDQAVNISERTLRLLNEPLLKPLIDIPFLAALSQEMLSSALRAFVTGDEALALEVCRRDDEVDRLNDQIYQELLAYMKRDPETVARAMDLMLIGRHLERVADHATNIAEDVYYLVRGSTLKHHLSAN